MPNICYKNLRNWYYLKIIARRWKPTFSIWLCNMSSKLPYVIAGDSLIVLSRRKVNCTGWGWSQLKRWTSIFIYSIARTDENIQHSYFGFSSNHITIFITTETNHQSTTCMFSTSRGLVVLPIPFATTTYQLISWTSRGYGEVGSIQEDNQME